MSAQLRTLFVLAISIACSTVHADGPQDNIPDKVRAVPPVGIEIPQADLNELNNGLEQLNASIAKLKSSKNAETNRLLPDVEIFARAVAHGIKYRELFHPRDIKNAKEQLQQGINRANALLKGQAPWTTQKGLVVRGYRSRIDRTVQPYGLVIPESYEGTGKSNYRLDLWFHGRGERSSESVFIAGRMKSKGRFTPRDTFVLHPYGRYSNAFKFAGEIDVLEALEHAQQNYRVDDDRIAVRGFSMGGAGCWQMAVHYPDLFFANNPGAGFSETPEFLKFFQKEKLSPTWYEKKLWQMYDCPGYADNLFQLPTVAYSGELDIQKQAADIMEEALAKKGLRLTHIIGPKTKHTIDANSMQIIESKLDALAEQGRAQLPTELRFATYTLKYNRLHWLTLTSLGQHWERATVKGKLVPNENVIDLTLKNVTGIRLAIPAGRSPFAPDKPVQVILSSNSQSQTIVGDRPGSDKSWECDLHFDGQRWNLGQGDTQQLRKQHNLQGPIDDAFMDSFIVVRPTGKANHELIHQRSQAELEHFVTEWRRHFRGDAIVKSDNEITDDDIQSSNLILFGDPQSNSVIASIIDQLPLKWTDQQITMGGKQFDASHHLPLLIYPNPKNQKRYVVLNSGFTYREFAYLNNARQVPKLPDWAIIDLNTPSDSLWPGKVVDANFFDERWNIK